MESKSAKVTQYKDPQHGVITVVEHKNGLMATNGTPSPNGRWVKRDNTYYWEETPNRAARRKAR